MEVHHCDVPPFFYCYVSGCYGLVGVCSSFSTLFLTWVRCKNYAFGGFGKTRKNKRK